MFFGTPVYELPAGEVVFGLRLPSVPPANGDTAITVPAAMENRLDLISALQLQADAAFWAIADASGMIDPFLAVTTGAQLRIPNPSRLPN